MGKTTNLLELLVQHHVHGTGSALDLLEETKRYHHAIAKQLFPDSSHPVHNEVANRFVEIEWILDEPPMDPYDYLYDQVVAVGELVSTTIVSHYLNSIGVQSCWIDARDYILTDNTHREGRVDWKVTAARIQKQLPELLERQLLVTQGFIGSTS